MWKVFRKKREVEEDSFKLAMFRMIFALAGLLKITPKRLANTYASSKPDEFATKFDDELIKLSVNESHRIHNLEKDLNG